MKRLVLAVIGAVALILGSATIAPKVTELDRGGCARLLIPNLGVKTTRRLAIILTGAVGVHSVF